MTKKDNMLIPNESSAPMPRVMKEETLPEVHELSRSINSDLRKLDTTNLQDVNDLRANPTRTNFEYMRDKDREPVRGVFRFYEVPGGNMKFPLRLHKGDPIKEYDLLDGGIYTIPLGVARHLNKAGSYPIHKYAQNEDGTSSQRVGQRVRRFGFQSLEFMDIEGVSDYNQIIQVDSTGL